MKKVITLFLLAIMLGACSDEERYVPKPKGYFRIDLPEKSYSTLDTIGRYKFECPSYATITHDPHSPNEKNWITIEFNDFKGSLHLTHKDVDGNLGEYLEDVHTMLSKHLQKANGIRDSLIVNPERNTYGMMIEIDGSDVATPLQFYLTDSTRNFVRGSLYFNFIPNNDSMRPVINYLKEDVKHIISTFEWKE